MLMKLAETTLWQRNLASLIRSGLLERAAIIEVNQLFAIVGIYGDGSRSASLAKYSDRRRAEDALNLVHHMLETDLAASVN